MNCKIEMATKHKLSLLFIILISGFKLGLAAPADGIKGKKRQPGRHQIAKSDIEYLMK